MEKRKKAYDEVEQIINKMRGAAFTFRSNNGSKDDWAPVIEQIYHKSLLSWVTSEIREKLQEITGPYMETMAAKGKDITPDEDFIQMLYDLEKIYFNDLVTLDDIDAFIRKNRIIEALPFTKAAGGNISTTE